MATLSEEWLATCKTENVVILPGNETLKEDEEWSQQPTPKIDFGLKRTVTDPGSSLPVAISVRPESMYPRQSDH